MSGGSTGVDGDGGGGAGGGADRLALVSGAHGFLGSHVVARLLREGWRVRALLSPWGDPWRLDEALAEVAGPPSAAAAEGDARLERVRADLADAATLAGVCRGVDAVIHAAARVREYGAWRPFWRTNVAGTAALLREAERAGVRRFVLVSSVAVFRYRGFRHADPRALGRDRFDQAYARSKMLAEDLVLAADLEGVVARPGLWPFGPRDPNLGRILAALRRGVLPLVGSGDAVINTAYAPQLAAGLARCAAHGAAAGRSYLLAEGEPVAWNDLFGELARLLGAPRPRLRLPPAPTAALAALAEPLFERLAPGLEPPLNRYRAELTVRDVHFSVAHAADELGFRSQTAWRDALAATVEAWRARRTGS